MWPLCQRLEFRWRLHSHPVKGPRLCSLKGSLCLGQRRLSSGLNFAHFKDFFSTCSFSSQPWLTQSPQHLCPSLDPHPHLVSWPCWDIIFAGSLFQVHLQGRLNHRPWRQCPLLPCSGLAPGAPSAFERSSGYFSLNARLQFSFVYHRGAAQSCKLCHLLPPSPLAITNPSWRQRKAPGVS